MVFMKLQDLQGIEATHLDYKISLEQGKPKSWLKSVVAFANTKGGHILFGVTDGEHEAVGLDDAQLVVSKVSELIKTRIVPQVRFIMTPFESDKAGRLCIDLEVSNGPDYPYYYVHEQTREIYVRHGDRSEVATVLEQNNLLLKGMNKTFDTLPSRYKMSEVSFTLLAAAFKKETGEDFDLSKDLFSMGLVTENNMVTNAGLLLCDQGYMKQSRIICTRWKGIDKGSVDGDALDDEVFSNSSLITLLSNAEAFIRINSKNPWTIHGMRREESSDYPFKAVREALVNALIHREYQNIGAEIHVDMYDNQMVISSPGGMGNGNKIQDLDLKHVPSMRRNEVISDIFDRLRFMDRRGSGLRRIIDSYHNYTVKPAFYSDECFFEVTMPNRSESVGNSDNESKTQLSSSKTQLSSSKTQLSSSKTQLCDATMNDVALKEWFKTRADGKFKNATLERIYELHKKYGLEYHFNRANISNMFNISENAASRIIKSCVECGIIRKEKKGEYYFFR